VAGVGPVAAALVEEARASVALDGETQVVGDGSNTVAGQGQPPSGVAPQPADAIAHRHTPDKTTVLSERYVMGIRWVTLPCSTCGEPLPERQA
jgi:hypothetical protein